MIVGKTCGSASEKGGVSSSLLYSSTEVHPTAQHEIQAALKYTLRSCCLFRNQRRSSVTFEAQRNYLCSTVYLDTRTRSSQTRRPSRRSCFEGGPTAPLNVDRNILHACKTTLLQPEPPRPAPCCDLNPIDAQSRINRVIQGEPRQARTCDCRG